MGTKRRAVPRRTGAEQDEFSAAGGMPVVPAGLPVTELRREKTPVRELTWGDFDRHVQTLAREVKPFRPQAVIGLAHGGVFVGGALASALNVEFHPLRITARSRDAGRASHASEELPPDMKGRRVLIVDDIANSGDTLVFALRLAKTAGVKAAKTAVLVSREGRYTPDFSAMVSDRVFVFPWDYTEVVDDQRFGASTAQATRAKKRPRP